MTVKMRLLKNVSIGGVILFLLLGAMSSYIPSEMESVASFVQVLLGIFLAFICLPLGLFHYNRAKRRRITGTSFFNSKEEEA